MKPGLRTTEAGALGLAMGVVALVAAMPEPSWPHVTLALGALAGAVGYGWLRTRLKLASRDGPPGPPERGQ